MGDAELCELFRIDGGIVCVNSVTSIGNGTFYGCRSLSNIGIPSCVTNIANFLFCGCRSLSDIVIPDSVTSIGIGAFSNCRFLSNIVIPDSVTNIRRGAFYKCNLPYRLEQNLISHFGNELFKFPLQIPGYQRELLIQKRKNLKSLLIHMIRI